MQDLLLFQAPDNYIDPAAPDTQPPLPPAPAQVGAEEESCVDSSCSMTRNALGVKGYPEFRAAFDAAVAPRQQLIWQKAEAQYTQTALEGGTDVEQLRQRAFQDAYSFSYYNDASEGGEGTASGGGDQTLHVNDDVRRNGFLPAMPNTGAVTSERCARVMKQNGVLNMHDLTLHVLDQQLVQASLLPVTPFGAEASVTAR
jgi:hypothetical protein